MSAKENHAAMMRDLDRLCASPSDSVSPSLAVIPKEIARNILNLTDAATDYQHNRDFGREGAWSNVTKAEAALRASIASRMLTPEEARAVDDSVSVEQAKRLHVDALDLVRGQSKLRSLATQGVPDGAK